MVRNKLFANLSFISTNYTNIVFANPFANKMFANVSVALKLTQHNIELMSQSASSSAQMAVIEFTWTASLGPPACGASCTSFHPISNPMTNHLYRPAREWRSVSFLSVVKKRMALRTLQLDVRVLPPGISIVTIRLHTWVWRFFDDFFLVLLEKLTSNIFAGILLLKNMKTYFF